MIRIDEVMHAIIVAQERQSYENRYAGTLSRRVGGAVSGCAKDEAF
jgi:hypothetical protein